MATTGNDPGRARTDDQLIWAVAGFSIVWPNFLAILVIGAVFFFAARGRFRRTLTQVA